MLRTPEGAFYERESKKLAEHVLALADELVAAEQRLQELERKEAALKEMLLALLDAGMVRGEWARQIRRALFTPEAEEPK